jgi:type I restriction-modification system DNA methylase subunit
VVKSILGDNKLKSLGLLYKELDLNSGDLQTATNDPALCHSRIDWLEKGEWLAAAKRAGVEKIFFVENNPVAVFAECGPDLLEKVKVFNKAWSLARPRLLFLATPGEITVYDLAQKPVDIKNETEWKKLNHLAALHDLAKVSAQIQRFHRDNIESGRLFGEECFGDLKNRADKALIRDLKIVRKELIDSGLSGDYVRFAHALIGRSIFIRYLEDRGVLTEEYFRKVAKQKAGWTDLLAKQQLRTGYDISEKDVFYPRALVNKDFTYALFRALARDFNGDMFPEVDEEEQVVTQKHLTLIQNLLYGNAGIAKKLFFYSYRFDIIPIDLISSIYEEFYHSSASEDEKKIKARQEGAYYTPTVLAEFVLSRVLPPDVLMKNPRILDPACGSGIFLVEAFRRIVRYNWHKKKQPLTFDELRGILKGQIAGIEANREAAKITAFSLYLSMLHYLEPPAIDQQIKLGNKLPNLIASSSRSENHFHCILPENAFDVGCIEANSIWKERFGPGCADVIVGNPPWGGALGGKADLEAKARQEVMLTWCSENKKPIGDKEPSQAFLWRALDFLKEGGRAGMLVSAGVLFKHGPQTQAFKTQWLALVRLNDVFNFTHVRKFFFKGADSPFLFICFNKEKQLGKPVQYWSAKQVTEITKAQAVTFSKYDLQILRDVDLSDSTVWKQFWFGRSADKDLLNFFRRHKKLIEFSDRKKTGQGFQTASGGKNAEVLKVFNNLVVDSFSNYDQLQFSKPPLNTYRVGVLDVYTGSRLLIQRGIEEKSLDKGRIVARYEVEPFCFTNAINGIKLLSPEEWKYKVILGILWSSVARYFFFMTASNWGLWHHEIHLEDELLQLPIVLDKSAPMTKEVLDIVDKLRNYQPYKYDILHPDGVSVREMETKRRKWEAELDEAVFALYGLNEEQKDLIRDCCEVTLPFFYKPFDSIGSMPAVAAGGLSWIEKYVHTFCKRWNAYLGDDEEMRAQIHVGAHGNMVAIEFFPADKEDPWDLKLKADSWENVLEEIGNNLLQPMGASRIVLDGVAHVVSKNGIVIIKRNEKRFWTRSLAREDADATLCKRMLDTAPKEAGSR